MNLVIDWQAEYVGNVGDATEECMIGEQIGPWTITRKISQGGMADVYLAEAKDPMRGAPGKAAIKLLRMDDLENCDRVLDRFHREADILRALKHENIVELYESGEFRGRPYLIMEYVDGLSLDRVLEQRGKLNWEEVVVIGQMVASALRFAHRQEVIHRDLKPANLLANWDRHVKLTDFGIARLLHDDRITKENAVVGTASYVSPEQAAGKPATRKSDIYSLGIILYELLTSRLPFEADSAAELLHKHRYAQFELPSRLVEDIPHDLDKLIESMLDKDPDKRPANALAVEDALKKLQKKYDRKKQYTPKPGAAVTKVMELEKSEEDELSQLRSKMRQQRPAFPALQAGILLLALTGVVAAWFWLRQPASSETLTNQIQQYLQQNDWNAAQARLDLLNKHHAASVPPEQRDELQRRITSMKTYVQAKVISGPYTFAPPGSEAERFYRRGVLAYYSGQVDEARATWTQLITAFKDISADSAWVRLAEEALKQSEGSTLPSIEKLLANLKENDAAGYKTRLQELKKLYLSLSESAWRTQALKAIEEQLGKSN